MCASTICSAVCCHHQPGPTRENRSATGRISTSPSAKAVWSAHPARGCFNPRRGCTVAISTRCRVLGFACGSGVMVFEVVWVRGLGFSRNALFRNISIAGLGAFGSFPEPCWWPSPLPPPPCHQPFQALDGCRQHVPLRFEVLNDAVEIHLRQPSEGDGRTRAARATLAGSGSSADSTGRRSSAATCRPS